MGGESHSGYTATPAGHALGVDLPYARRLAAAKQSSAVARYDEIKQAFSCIFHDCRNCRFAVAGTGQIEVDEAQAAIVRRIFTMFADGHSPREIAEALNGEGVSSPGATWGRETRRKRGWVASAIQGNPARGLGILNNDTYRGVVVWNRSRWIRSAADSSKRRQVQNPKKEWITRQEERLRIVSDELWQRVKARQADQARGIGDRVSRGMSKAAAARSGTGVKFLLSGLLRCSHCGSAYSIAGANRYACTGHTNGGISLCDNNATLRRQVAEAQVTAAIKRGLRDPQVIEEICARYRAAIRETPKAVDHSGRIAQLRNEAERLADAIASGVLRASPTLAQRLVATERELEELEARQAVPPVAAVNVTQLLADLPARAERAVERLEETLATGDVPRAREEIKSHVGMVTIEADEREIRLWSEKGNIAAATHRRRRSYKDRW